MPPARLLPALALLAAPASAQLPGSADPSPTPPPTATWPVLADESDAVEGPDTTFDDVGSGRGHAIADVVGPDPADPTNPDKVGPPDGILDLVQTNSNTPPLPLGAPPAEQITPAIGSQQVPSLVLRGAADGTFTDVTEHMSPHDPEGFNVAYPGGSPWGVVAGDVEGDGDLDLFYACGGFNTGSPNSLLRNEGDGTFRNVSQQAGITHVQSSYSAAWLDADLDGDLDLYVANAGELFPHFYDGPVPDPVDRLYRNDGTGAFQDVAPVVGTDLRSNGFSVTTGDLDRNGWPDVVVSCFLQHNKVFYNDGTGFTFMGPPTNPSIVASLDDLVPDPSVPGSFDFPALTDVEKKTLPVMGVRSMPVQLLDVNNDGWLDAFFSSWSTQLPDADPYSAVGATFEPAERGYLYLNRGDGDGDGIGDGLFRECAVEVGLDHVGGAMGLVAGDVNADGFPDVYLGGGGPDLDDHFEEDFLYVNEPTAWPADFQADPTQPLPRAFYEVGALVGTYANLYMAHGLTTFARDGRLDVVVGNGGPAMTDSGQANVYWRNTGNADGIPGRSVLVSLEPSRSAPGAPNARIEVVRGGPGGAGQVQTRERQAGFGFTSHDGGPAFFGYGGDELLYAGVHWPSGVREGRVLWLFDPTPSELAFQEGTLSLGLDATYPAGGGVELALEAVETGPGSWQGTLLLAILAPAGGGAFVPTLVPLVPDLVLQPDVPFALSATVPAPITGLWTVLLVDPTSGAIDNAAAVWHEPALERSGVAAASVPPIDLRRGGLPGARDATIARSRLTAGAARASLAPARAPLAWEPLGPGEHALPDGTVVRVSEGRVEVELGAAPGEVSWRGGRPVLSLGRAMGCCDTRPRGQGTFLALEGAAWVTVDGVRYAPDGRPRSGRAEPWQASSSPATKITSR